MKTTFKPLRPDQVWQPSIGPRKGNRNALKGGFHTAEARALRRQIAALVKRANVAVAEIHKKLPRAKPGPKPGSRKEKPEPPEAACGKGGAASKRMSARQLALGKG